MVNHKSFKRKSRKRRTYKKRSHRSFKKSFRRTKRTNKSRSRPRRKYNRKQRGGFDGSKVVDAIKSKPGLATLVTAGTGITGGIYGGDAESALLGAAGGATLSGLGYAYSKAKQAKDKQGDSLYDAEAADETSSILVDEAGAGGGDGEILRTDHAGGSTDLTSG